MSVCGSKLKIQDKVSVFDRLVVAIDVKRLQLTLSVLCVGNVENIIVLKQERSIVYIQLLIYCRNR